MKKLKNLPLTLKLLSSFLIAIFVLSAFHLFTYLNLLDTLTKETIAGANQRMSSASDRLDESIAYVRNSYYALTYTSSFRKAANSGNPSEYDRVDLYDKANLFFERSFNIAAFAILFRNSNQVVTSSGNYTDIEFFSNKYSSDQYSVEFWRQEKLAAFAQRYYPTSTFSRKSPITKNENESLLPVAFKPYWNNNIMVLMLIDIKAICNISDDYLNQDFYIFDAQQLLYSSEKTPAITTLPTQEKSLTQNDDGSYVAVNKSAFGDFTYVKILPKNSIVGQIANLINLTFFIAVAALAVGIAIVVFAVSRLMHPVTAILKLISNEDEPMTASVNELAYIHTNIASMQKQRNQYVEQLSKKDEALSGFLLQSQLKNIYVDLDSPNQTLSADQRVFCILYVRIHYRNGVLDFISHEPSAIAHMLLENMQQTLNNLFENALIFQLEPAQFVAKISVPLAKQDITDQMQHLLQRLNNENEFAFFTVVQSNMLQANDDFTRVYEQVLDGAQHAIVNNTTQLILLPLADQVAGGFSFALEQEQQLSVLISDGCSDEASQLVEGIIHRNLQIETKRIHIMLLCSAIISSTMRTLSQLYINSGVPNINSSSAYTNLSQCDTDKDYINLVCDFVRSAALCALLQPRTKEPVIDGVNLFLEKNYQREFSMDELAQSLHLSKSYISTYYKSKTGANLSDRIQYVRIQKATQLLANPKLRVGDIGEMVGISNINTFLRQFKKYTGMTPKEYRVRKLSMQ